MAPSNQTHRPLAACRGAGSSHALALSMTSISISASGTPYILLTTLFPLRLFCQ
ncbi:TPA: hypothetical protein ACHUBE_000491 [Klebsiella quasipneumoniae]|uniref:hypothetical protein n=1 Tax=Klebsiella quasipneumoniae TaxID=1463165 RepID=UPI002B412948|nr:hypothetical protein [Klebsiella quasipneumoniae]